jgi:rubrerythrin
MNTENVNTFIKTQLENMKNISGDEKKQFQGQHPDVKKKKKEKKKRKKLGSYKKLLRSIKKSTKTEQEQKEAYRKRLKQSLGGGSFKKISSI